MPVPANTFATLRLRWMCALALLFSVAAVPLFGRGPEPETRIPLDSLGFQAQSPQFLEAGSSMFTLNYVDDHHLLLTFGVHKLMERIPNDPPDDEDRMVEAVLLEAPSGKVLARADWRLHDSGQYLWSLGHGRFLLRSQGKITTFAPMANLASGQSFQQRGFLATDRKIGALLLSPEADLLIVESVERTPPVPPPPTPLFGPAPKPTPAPLGRPGDQHPVALSFYRLSIPDDSGDQVTAILAGVAHAVRFGDVAATAAGHIGVVDKGRQHWSFDFQPYAGEPKELSAFDSTCRPTPRFVSSSEFVAFGCHGGDLPHVLGGFNMSGEEMWEQNLYGDYVAMSMVYAPSSGRFAMGRVLGEGSTDLSQAIPGPSFTGQDVMVYQMESGKQLLHIDCSPIARAGQNFALSPDGMKLAVIRKDAIEVYALPPLSPKDQNEVKEARAMVPKGSVLPIDFAGPTPSDASTDTPSSAQESVKAAAASEQSSAGTTTAGTSPDVPKPTNVSASAAPAPKPTVNSSPAGDAAPEEPRKPPTLYTLPGDDVGREGETK